MKLNRTSDVGKIRSIKESPERVSKMQGVLSEIIQNTTKNAKN